MFYTFCHSSKAAEEEKKTKQKEVRLFYIHN